MSTQRDESLEACAAKFASQTDDVKQLTKELLAAVEFRVKPEDVALHLFRLYASGWLDGADYVLEVSTSEGSN